MTTIAFDGRVLAAERIQGFGDIVHISPTPKIVISDRYLCAGQGSAADGDALIEWLVAGADKDAIPQGIPDTVSLIVIDRERPGVWFATERGRLTPLPTPFAMGAGHEIAMGAMTAGASAIDAVRIACLLCPNSRGPVDYVLVNQPWTIRTIHEPYIPAVRREEDGLNQVRLISRANGGLAPHLPHEGNA